MERRRIIAGFWPVALYAAAILTYLCCAGWCAFANRYCNADEPSVMDPAIQFATTGSLSIPSAGPGAGHADAYFYQLQLHPLLLGVWMRFLGVSLVSAHLFSLVLGLAALLVLLLFRKPFGLYFVGIAAWMLVAESGFVGRMSIVRYDGISLILTLLAIAIAVAEDGFSTSRTRWLAAGLCIGVAAMSNFLFIIYGPAIWAAYALAHVRRAPREVVMTGCVLAIGLCTGLAPAVVFAIQNRDAFMGQFVFQITSHREQSLSLPVAEFKKYYLYYARRPFVPLFYTASVAWILWTAMRPGAGSRKVLSFALLAVTGTVFLTIASGSKSWHQFVIAPALTLAAVGAMVVALEQMPDRGGIWAQGLNAPICILLLGALAVANGLALGPVRMVLQAALEEGSRNYDVIEKRVLQLIPAGSEVYGTRRLLITAHENGWDYVADYGNLFNTDPDLGADRRFGWLVVEAGMEHGFFVGLPPEYRLVDSFSQPISTIDRLVIDYPLLGKFFYYGPLKEFNVYKLERAP